MFWRILFQQFHIHLYGLLQLRIVTFTDEFWILLHLIIRRNTVVFHVPVAI